jgi:hypothetical protein
MTGRARCFEGIIFVGWIFVGWAKRSVPTILIELRDSGCMVGTLRFAHPSVTGLD